MSVVSSATQSNPLRLLIENQAIYAAPAVYDCLGAMLAEQAGFEFIFSSGFGMAASQLGKPDFGYLTATEMVDTAGRIANSVDIPLLADMDTGYGNPLNVYQMVENVVQKGVAGILLEDQEWPKRCGHFEGKRVISPAEQIQKIKAAREASADSGLVIVARTDARAIEGLSAAMARGEQYLAAGADVLFIEAPQSRQELQRVADEFKGVPLMANIIEGGKTPNLSVDELDDMGYRLVAFALSGLFSVTQAFKETFQTLKETGSTAALKQKMDFDGFKQVIDMDKHIQLEERYLSGTAINSKSS